MSRRETYVRPGLRIRRQLLEFGYLRHTRGTPGGPEVEHHDVAFERSFVYCLAFKRRDGEIRNRGTDDYIFGIDGLSASASLKCDNRKQDESDC